MFHCFIFGALKWESERSQYFMLKTWKEARFCISLCGSQHSKGMEYEYFARFGKNSLKIVLCHHFQFSKVGKRSLSNIWKHVSSVFIMGIVLGFHISGNRTEKCLSLEIKPIYTFYQELYCSLPSLHLISFRPLIGKVDTTKN